MPQILHIVALTTCFGNYYVKVYSLCSLVSIKLHLMSYSQHSMGREATCRARTRPGGATGGARGRWVRNTRRTRVFFRPTSVSPFLSSMSEFLSFRIPAQSMLRHKECFLNCKWLQGRVDVPATSCFTFIQLDRTVNNWNASLVVVSNPFLMISLLLMYTL